MKMMNLVMFMRAIPAGKEINVRTTGIRREKNAAHSVLLEPPIGHVEVFFVDEYILAILLDQRPAAEGADIVSDYRADRAAQSAEEARREIPVMLPGSFMRNCPASGIMISLGRGIPQLSIAINMTTPTQPTVSYSFSRNGQNVLIQNCGVIPKPASKYTGTQTMNSVRIVAHITGNYTQ